MTDRWNRIFFGGIFILLWFSPPGFSATFLADTVIRDHQLWQGEIRISGVVRVTRNGSLRIAPGTHIFFERFDRDQDGIGDAEIRVEGTLEIAGSSSAPVLLTSAAENPQPADWKFLYLDYARKAEIRYLISEYAYSGIQIHFSRAQVTQSEFRYNIDGVRFSTANIQLSQSRIHHNRHGIRYEERGGKGIIRYNQISRNQVGIFAVTRAEGRTRFVLNNLEDNRPYQVKLGLRQSQSLDFPRNWWGSAAGLDPKTVFDQTRDATLGRVTASAALKTAVNIVQGEE